MSNHEEYLHNCLYFTANTLSRVITSMAEEEFNSTGLSPNQAFLLMIVTEYEGIMSSKLGKKLHLAPSTITRFVDKLEHMNLVFRETEGKKSLVFSTDEGKKVRKKLDIAWKNLYERYTTILGEKAAINLTKDVDTASKKLENHYYD